MGVPVEKEELEKFRELNRLRMKLYRDKKRQRKYSPRPDTRKNCVVPKKSKETEE